MLQLDRGAMHRTIEDWSRQFGDTFRVSLARRDMLVVTDPALISRDTARSARGISPHAPDRGDPRRNGNQRCICFPRRALAQAAVDGGGRFRSRHIKAYFPSLARVTERLYKRWSEHAAKDTEFDLRHELMLYTVDVVAGLAFGVDINTIESENASIQTHLNYVFPMLNRRMTSVIHYWRWLQLPADRRLDVHMAEIVRAVKDLIAQARRRLQEDAALRDAPTNLIEAMLVA